MSNSQTTTINVETVAIPNGKGKLPQKLEATLESVVPTEVPLPVVASVETFNPLSLLSDEMRKAMGTRYNKTWLSPRIAQIQNLQTEHKIGFFEACFTLAMLEDASNLVVAKKIARTADTMFNLAGELFSSAQNVEAALHQIEAAYDNLDAFQQPQAGKRFRQLVSKGFTSHMTVRVLTMVCEKLGVREVEWI